VDKCRNDVVGVFPNAVELLRLARSSGSHTNSDTPVAMPFSSGVVLVAALELFA
jgi:hypothetical protein